MKKLILALILLSFPAFASQPVAVYRVRGAALIGTGTTMQLTSALPANVEVVDIFNSAQSGTLTLMVGRSGSEGTVLIISPGERTTVPLDIGKGARLGVQATDAQITTGDVQINLYGSYSF